MPVRQKILLGILAVVAIYWVMTTFVMGPDTAPAPPESAAINPAPRTAAVKQPQPGRNAAGMQAGGLSSAPAGSTLAAYMNEWGPRDPFYRHYVEVVQGPVGETAVTTEGLVLKGIQWSKGEALIVINDEILRINDIVNGFKLVRAGIDYVVLQRGTNLETLRLGGKK